MRSVEHLKGSIANRHPIVIGMNVYSSFYRLSGPSSVYNNLRPGDRPGGGHAVTLVGYDDDRVRRRVQGHQLMGPGLGR